jgi:hypothetical protein
MNWLIGIVVIIVGFLLVVKTQWIVSFTGPIAWAEQHLGTEGGTQMFIKLLGVLAIFLALLSATGGLGCMLRGFLGPALKPL